LHNLQCVIESDFAQELHKKEECAVSTDRWCSGLSIRLAVGPP